MLNYILRRLFVAVFLLLGVAIVSWVVIQLPPGDFATTYETFLMNQGGITQEEARERSDKLREQLGLDQPQWKQFYLWIKGIVTEGKFGYSFAYRRDVGELVAERLGYTIILALSAHFISTVVGVLVGIYVAQRKYSLSDNVASVIAFVLASVPRFWIALVIIYMLVFTFNQHHVTSFFSPEYVLEPWSWAKVWDFIKHTWPIVFIAGLGGVARNMRVMRGNLLDELQKQYVITARAKGLPEREMLFRYPVRIAVNPIISTIGWVLPSIVGGEVLVSIVLNLQTTGPVLLQAVRFQDMYLAGSITLILSILTVIGTLIGDILLVWLDPRIRFGKVGE